MIMAGAATMLVGTVSTINFAVDQLFDTLQAILTSSTTLAQLYVGRVVTGIVRFQLFNFLDKS